MCGVLDCITELACLSMPGCFSMDVLEATVINLAVSVRASMCGHAGTS